MVIMHVYTLTRADFNCVQEALEHVTHAAVEVNKLQIYTVE